MTRVLFFCPRTPLPVTGAPQQRFLSLLQGFGALGCDTTLAYLVPAGAPGPTPGEREQYRGLGVRSVEPYRYTPRDLRAGAWVQRVRRLWSRRAAVSPSLALAPGVRRWFGRLTAAVRPDVVVVSFAYWDWLVDRRTVGSAVLVMDTLDLVSRQQRLWAALAPHVRRDRGTVEVDPAVLAADFDVRVGYEVDRFEAAVYDRYDHTLAISLREADILRASCRRTAVHFLPMSFPALPATTEEPGGLPLFPLADHLLPAQGYAFLVRRVLPLVRAAAPDFRVRVIGPGCAAARPADGVDLAGFAPDLRAEYDRARFVLNPILAGTGQPVKVVEAMAHGRPVVLWRWAEAASPVRHGESGFVADTAEQFAEYTARLWSDPALCRRMGAAARETAARFHAAHRPADTLAELLPIAGGRP
ncbi:MAG: hypothetical protein JWO38_5367 [Gemmataceae bacterium]|nr:hypothetical protein [Gemmataceae bacterium]